ncbi:DUF4430 domain-containing protein [Candidatus Parcubacteria bacterium]|jgi:hypothetical protein|nr:DUF4430 domain-containing protein [Candidatus Parcubacteria bacterium]MBT3948696.1 DUF4430 domain-containing protein [Candidatus Parcubacteria bacterium]
MKNIVGLILFAIFLSGCSTTSPPQITTPEIPEQKTEVISRSTETQNVKITDVEKIVIQKTTTTSGSNTEDPKPTTTIKEEIEDKTILIVEGKTYTLPYLENNSVHDVMMTLSAMSSQPFYFEVKEYTGMGYFVTSINGKKQDTRQGKYWIYYINDESAKLGISNYIINQGDVIKWTYGE